MNKIFCFLFILALTGCFNSQSSRQKEDKEPSGQSIRFEEYFPLKENAVYVYHVRFDGISGGKKVEQDDSAICKSYPIEGTDVFYFDRRSDNDGINIGSITFCFGAFYYDKGRFMFLPLDWRRELEESKKKDYAVLFPAATFIGSVYQNAEGNKKVTYKFTGFETIKINDKSYPDCLKLEMKEIWPEKEYTGTVWFQKGVGIVKWIRFTGRVEELKE
jgi:hypothetical protein